MLVSQKWLNQYVDLSDLQPAEIASHLTMLGLEVESVKPSITFDEMIVLGKIETAIQHPNADTLRLCEVMVSASEKLQIVCGAPNARAGIYVAVATKGAKLPDGTKIKPGKIRGVESQGMMCSEAELGMSDNHEGILELSEGALGRPLGELISSPDFIFEISLTPNRSDALGVIGIARDLAAKLKRPLQMPRSEIAKTPSVPPLAVDIALKEAVPRFCSVVVKGVKVAPSPAWLQQAITHAGMRPRNNLVDISNYIMLEWGQPNHIYDLATIKGRKLRVIHANAGESMTLIDGSKATLADQDIMIADESGYVGVAGIMGGQHSEVTDATTEIAIEVAVFDPVQIRKTSLRLAKHTDASHRFERGVDIMHLPHVLNRIVELVRQLHPEADLEISAMQDFYPQPFEPKRIALRLPRAKAVLGWNGVTLESSRQYLEGIGCRFIDQIEERTLWEIPSWRQDLCREIDLIEELARMHGLDAIPATAEKFKPSVFRENPLIHFSDVLRQTFAAEGLSEVMTLPFVSDADTAKLSLPVDHAMTPSLRLKNPVSEGEPWLQASLIPGLLQSLRRNRDHGTKGARLFEVGRTYAAPRQGAQLSQLMTFKVQNEAGRCVETLRLAGAVDHPFASKSWASAAQPLNFHQVKSILTAAMGRLNPHSPIDYQPIDRATYPFLHPGASAVLLSQGLPIGWVGELHPEASYAWGFDEVAPIVFELNVELLQDWSNLPAPPLEMPSKFPPVTRDIALVVKKTLPYAALPAAIKTFPQKKHLTSSHLFDVYEGSHLQDDEKSFAIACLFTSHEKTLTDKEVDEELRQLVAHLAQQTGAALRS
jgi:phenylalanyl-tRNA synthetase beta chain